MHFTEKSHLLLNAHTHTIREQYVPHLMKEELRFRKVKYLDPEHLTRFFLS